MRLALGYLPCYCAAQGTRAKKLRKDDAAKKKKKQAVGGFGSDAQDVSRSVASPLYSQGTAQGEGDHKPAWEPEMDEEDPI